MVLVAHQTYCERLLYNSDMNTPYHAKPKLMRYALLLRGINVGGKHKVSMDRLKADLMELGLRRLASYINSGNLFFDSSEPEEAIRRRLAHYFDATYDFPLPFIIISATALRHEVAQLPSWWQDNAAHRRDVLFYLPGVDKAAIEVEVATWANGHEQLYFGCTAFFYCNYNQADYLKSNYHKKLLKAQFYKQLTIRNGKTFQKIVELTLEG